MPRILSSVLISLLLFAPSAASASDLPDGRTIETNPYLDGHQEVRFDNAEDICSFFSGHTATAFAAMTSFSMLATYRGRSKAWTGLSWGVGMGAFRSLVGGVVCVAPGRCPAPSEGDLGEPTVGQDELLFF